MDMEFKQRFHNHVYKFRFIRMGGTAIGTQTSPLDDAFASSLTVALMSEPADMKHLFVLLVKLVERRFNNWIITRYATMKPQLSGYEFHVPTDDDPDGAVLIISMNYKVIMPRNLA